MTKDEALKHLKAVIEAFGPDEGIELDQRAWSALHSAIKETLAQPEQQPVGWIDDGGEVFWRDKPPEDGADLYTTSPQRKPLTDEHPLMVFAKECVLGAYQETELADAAQRAIKAAHGIKE